MITIEPGYKPSVIDIEASGFGPDSYPIEIGVALGDGKKYCSLVYPAPHWTHWDGSAEQVHRIPRDILEEYGKPIDRVAAELNDILNGRTVYSDGWVVDHPWVNKLFQESKVSAGFSTSALEMILSEKQMEIWHETKDRVSAEMALTRHRASNDAFIIQKTWIATREMTA